MSGFTKLGFPLIFILLIFSLLGLAAKFLYHRCSRFPADPERSYPFGDGPAPGALLIRALCFKFKHRSRIEPASAVDSSRTKAPLAQTGEECDLARWHAVCLGPSRALYTIKEETEEEDDDADETPFATPCASFQFYSEAPSLPSEALEVVADAGEAESLRQRTIGAWSSQALRGDKCTVVSGEIHDKVIIIS